MTKITFDTCQFEFSHGRMPRGRGSWAFAFDRRCDVYFFVPGSMLFQEAKKEAKKMYAEQYRMLIKAEPSADEAVLYVCS